MTREGLYRLTLRALAIAFALGGAIFFIAPDSTIRSLNATGALLGEFSPAKPPSAPRLWVSLAVAYMVLVMVLAWVAQRDLRRYRHLLAILAAGKGASSLTSLLYYWFSADAFAYLLTFLVDGAIALTAIWIWFGVPKLGAGAVTGKEPRAGGLRDGAGPDRTLDALLEALIPPGGAFREGPLTLSFDETANGPVTETSDVPGFRFLLRVLDLSPFFLPPIWLRRFSRLSLEDRTRLLRAWDESRFWPRRQLLYLLKVAALPPFYARPEIQARLGYPHPLERVPAPDLPAGEGSP